MHSARARSADGEAAQIPQAAAAGHPWAAMPGKAAKFDARWLPAERTRAAAARPRPQPVHGHRHQEKKSVPRTAVHLPADVAGRCVSSPVPRHSSGPVFQSCCAWHGAHSAGTAPSPPGFAAWRETPARRPGRSGLLWCRNSSCAKNLAYARILARADCSNPPLLRYDHRTFWREELLAVHFPFA